ncbi:hypothetical protein MF672_036405 [Actinomadura sp. ATCC 31491]|uniref:Uncharacterized protein n=1 Tax=Actinomadura luzonensis TaxID=2805427 RepID=A0ABT0G541_9ACTN|nr:hypothetical protein [Actinomadura luzonensis]MCK2219238.1 hypothetical protein [Actinomadura luzonensis]
MRHLLGAAAGLAALVPVYYLTEAGARALREGTAAAGPSPAGLGCLMAVAALVALLAAWPAAALACGLPLAAAARCSRSTPPTRSPPRPPCPMLPPAGCPGRGRAPRRGPSWPSRPARSPA